MNNDNNKKQNDIPNRFINLTDNEKKEIFYVVEKHILKLFEDYISQLTPEMCLAKILPLYNKKEKLGYAIFVAIFVYNHLCFIHSDAIKKHNDWMSGIFEEVDKKDLN